MGFGANLLIVVLISYQAYPGYEIHRVERPAAVVPVPQVAPGAVRPHQVPPARQLVGIQPPKPPQAKYTFDESESNVISSYQSQKSFCFLIIRNSSI